MVHVHTYVHAYVQSYIRTYLSHLQVLACAPSNIAVDNLVERLARAKVKVRACQPLCMLISRMDFIAHNHVAMGCGQHRR